MIIKIYNQKPPESSEIRKQVFIDEQGFWSYDYDEKDDISAHIVAYCGEDAIGTCRIYQKDIAGVYMFGRLAVKNNMRNSGVGGKMVDAAIEYAKQNGGVSIVLLDQMGAKDFYIKKGFVSYGETVYEQGKAHIWMKKEL